MDSFSTSTSFRWIALKGEHLSFCFFKISCTTFGFAAGFRNIKKQLKAILVFFKIMMEKIKLCCHRPSVTIGREAIARHSLRLTPWQFFLFIANTGVPVCSSPVINSHAHAFTHWKQTQKSQDVEFLLMGLRPDEMITSQAKVKPWFSFKSWLKNSQESEIRDWAEVCTPVSEQCYSK